MDVEDAARARRRPGRGGHVPAGVGCSTTRVPRWPAPSSTWPPARLQRRCARPCRAGAPRSPSTCRRPSPASRSTTTSASPASCAVRAASPSSRTPGVGRPRLGRPPRQRPAVGACRRGGRAAGHRGRRARACRRPGDRSRAGRRPHAAGPHRRPAGRADPDPAARHRGHRGRRLRAAAAATSTPAATCAPWPGCSASTPRPCWRPTRSATPRHPSTPAGSSRSSWRRVGRSGRRGAARTGRCWSPR